MYSEIIDIVKLAEKHGVHVVAITDAAGYFIIETKPETVESDQYKAAYKFIKDVGFSISYVIDPVPLMGTEVDSPYMFRKDGNKWVSWFRFNSNDIEVEMRG